MIDRLDQSKETPMTETPDEARLRRLRGRVNAVTTLLAITPLVYWVPFLVLTPSMSVELDSPAMAVGIWFSLASFGVSLAVPLVYVAALLMGVRPAHPADVVRGVLTLMLAWLPLLATMAVGVAGLAGMPQPAI